MKLKNVLLSLTAGAMLVAPIAAQAGTTAAASTGKLASLSGLGERKAAGVAKKNKADGDAVILGVAAAAVAVGGIILIADGDGNKSNGS